VHVKLNLNLAAGALTGPGCVIGTSSREGYGVRAPRPAGDRKRGLAGLVRRAAEAPQRGVRNLLRRTRGKKRSLTARIGVCAGAFVLAGGSTFGLMELGLPAEAAGAISVAGGKVAVEAGIAMVNVARRRKNQRDTTTVQRTADERHVPPSPTAPAVEQPGGAN
jgi:hypothetical protein